MIFNLIKTKVEYKYVIYFAGFPFDVVEMNKNTISFLVPENIKRVNNRLC